MIDAMRIAFTGPECSGKTTLSKWLAGYLGVPYIAEYAREYLSPNQPYFQADLHQIAQAQFTRNHEFQQCVCDTEMTVCRIWEAVVFNSTSALLDHLVNSENYGLVFLCSPDIPWISDPLRENPHDRAALFVRYKEDLEKRKIDYWVVEGSISERKEIILSKLSERFPNFTP
mgnify:FL=1